MIVLLTSLDSNELQPLVNTAEPYVNMNLRARVQYPGRKKKDENGRAAEDKTDQNDCAAEEKTDENGCNGEEKKDENGCD